MQIKKVARGLVLFLYLIPFIPLILCWYIIYAPFFWATEGNYPWKLWSDEIEDTR